MRREIYVHIQPFYLNLGFNGGKSGLQQHNLFASFEAYSIRPNEVREKYMKSISI